MLVHEPKFPPNGVSLDAWDILTHPNLFNTLRKAATDRDDKQQEEAFNESEMFRQGVMFKVSFMKKKKVKQFVEIQPAVNMF